MPQNAQKDSDHMSFLSFNSALPVLESLKRKRKTLYIQSVVEEARPQLCSLPEQIPDLTITGYRTSLCQSGEGPVLLYDINRVVLTQFHTDDNDQYTAIDYSDFVVAGVSVLSNTIPSHVDRKFSLVTWRGALFAEPIAVAVHKLVSYLHRLTYATGEPVLSVGSIPANASVEIRKAVTTECQLHDEVIPSEHPA
ncbi:uncharacterized protein LOC127876001 [Dreissena polymorpha]|uniref:uncharacterized protein LOC127876001 n=1 Tax=Dreissena polymorpha TaxID=45954 RepID=UPI002263C597|nr:uncharacterized protein LOC127876001 [Dreissena polymorpha]XP_052276781.1 uncharacterized protein LOC127876001 [Dreissena polymorpha]XP_052276782.1 uncharacterized protein LOC127876001 [Dreissena polymorpha]XP_052276783.1 uncharacterized protein LOC127876001 [Dreissena polymorpha]